MALVLGDLYSALREAGASEAKAHEAAAEVLAAIRPSPMHRGGLAGSVGMSVSNLILVYMCGIATGLAVPFLFR